MSDPLVRERVCLVQWAPIELNRYLDDGWTIKQTIPAKSGFYAVIEKRAPSKSSELSAV